MKALSKLVGKVTSIALDNNTGKVSSKRITNLGVTATLVTFAINDMSENGLNWENIVLALAAMVFSFAMSAITSHAETLRASFGPEADKVTREKPNVNFVREDD